MSLFLEAIVPNSDGIQNYVLQYGILGVITVVLAYVAFQQYQKLIERNEMLEEKIDNVQKEMNDLLIEERDRMMKLIEEKIDKVQREMNDLLIEERDRMMKLIEENTKALNELQKAILNFMITNK